MEIHIPDEVLGVIIVLAYIWGFVEIIASHPFDGLFLIFITRLLSEYRRNAKEL